MLLIQGINGMISVYTPGEYLSAQPSPHEVIPRRILLQFIIGPPESPYIVYIISVYNKYDI